MNGYHEPYESLAPPDRDLHRALLSLKEEIEAVDWYHQRVVTCTDPDLGRVLAHNRDEEIEHACMTLEWVRRTTPAWDLALRKFVFTEGSITQNELHPASAPLAAWGGLAEPPRGDLGIGHLHDPVEPREAHDPRAAGAHEPALRSTP